jgi:hypothetical protein
MRRRAAFVLLGSLLLAIPERPASPKDAPDGDAKRVGGLVALDPDLSARWCWAGAWRYPVGDPLDFESASPEGAPGYHLNRNVGREGGHQGADLDNRRAGDLVRAAAHGVAIVSSDSGWNGGYGGMVVLAHRLADDEVVFSVYAHLSKGSVAVDEGSCVRAGQPIGRVGRTGRASTSHLHFEVRVPADPFDRWERSRVVDPIAFVAARLRPARAETTWADPYLAWAEDAALLPAGGRSGEPLDRARWWSMLAHAARFTLERLPDDPLARRAALIAAGILPEDAPRDALGRVGWNELAWDLDRLASAGTRVPAPELAPGLHRECCERQLSNEYPSRRPRALARHSGAGPSLAQACLAVADAAGPAPAPSGAAPGSRPPEPKQRSGHGGS